MASQPTHDELNARDRLLLIGFSVAGLLFLLGGSLLPVIWVRRHDWVFYVIGVVLVLVGQQFLYRIRQRQKLRANGAQRGPETPTTEPPDGA